MTVPKQGSGLCGEAARLGEAALGGEAARGGDAGLAGAGRGDAARGGDAGRDGCAGDTGLGTCAELRLLTDCERLLERMEGVGVCRPASRGVARGSGRGSGRTSGRFGLGGVVRPSALLRGSQGGRLRQSSG